MTAASSAAGRRHIITMPPRRRRASTRIIAGRCLAAADFGCFCVAGLFSLHATIIDAMLRVVTFISQGLQVTMSITAGMHIEKAVFARLLPRQ